jgi:hypothetical protein
MIPTGDRAVPRRNKPAGSKPAWAVSRKRDSARRRRRRADRNAAFERNQREVARKRANPDFGDGPPS